MTEKINYIREQLPPGELLAQLAEEAGELAHAALKLRRAYDKTNPTPVDKIDALANLAEEISDVLLCLEVLGIIADPKVYREDMTKKLARWAGRLKEAEG